MGKVVANTNERIDCHPANFIYSKTLMSPDAEQLVGSFFNQLLVERGASVHTLSSYQRDIKLGALL